MRDPARIDRILMKLGCLWEHAPDMRLGQLLTRALSNTDDWLFYLEDDELEQALDALDKRLGCGAACDHVHTNPGWMIKLFQRGGLDWSTMLFDKQLKDSGLDWTR